MALCTVSHEHKVTGWHSGSKEVCRMFMQVSLMFTSVFSCAYHQFCRKPISLARVSCDKCQVFSFYINTLSRSACIGHNKFVRSLMTSMKFASKRKHNTTLLTKQIYSPMQQIRDIFYVPPSISYTLHDSNYQTGVIIYRDYVITKICPPLHNNVSGTM